MKNLKRKRVTCVVCILILVILLEIDRQMELTIKQERICLLGFFAITILAFIISGTMKEIINNCKKTINFWTENCLNSFIGYSLSIFSILVYLVFCLLIYWFPILLTFLNTYKEETEPKSI